jgi:selenocysteine lyase/cysteine desulfurase
MHRPTRDDFELPDDVVYLNGSYLSPLPRAARAALEEGYRMKQWPFTVPPDTQLRRPDLVRERLAPLMDVPADEISVTTSTHYGVMLIAQGIRWRAGDRVLIGPDEYPTSVYPWLALEERGVRAEFVGTPGRPLAADQLEAALAHGGPVRALCIGALHYATGTLHPLSELAARLAPHGAHLIVDGAQAVGAIALDWDATGADAVLLSGYKWVYGPFGIGAMWVRPALRDRMANVNANWLALEAAADFNHVMAHYPRDYRPHGRLFDVGQAGSYLNVAVLNAGLDYLAAVGVAEAEAHYRRLQDRLLASLEGVPLTPVTDLTAPHRGPMLFLAGADGVDVAKLVADLAERQVYVSLRGGRMRVSPGLWNDDDHVAAFARAVKDLLGRTARV